MVSDPSLTPGAAGSAGRRRAQTSARRRPSPLVLLALVIPLLTVAALFLVRPAETPVVDQPAQEAPLTRSSVVCPPALDGAGTTLATQLALGSAGRGGGVLTLREGGDEQELTVEHGLAGRTSARPVVAIGEDDLAPGLLGLRHGGGAAAACTQPEAGQWFTGAGAGAEHQSTLVLTNPDRGPAVADVTLWGPDGPLDVPELRGVRVRGGETARHDLADVVPTRGALALRVEVSRGRLGVHVADSVDAVGRAAAARDWLPAQIEPAESSYLLGLGASGGTRTLTVANPGDDEVRVGIDVVADRSEFRPAGLEEVRIRPGSVVEVDLTDVLGSDVARGARGIKVDSTGPVTAALRTVNGDDLIASAAGQQVTEPAGAVLPGGPKRLVVAGATAPGVLVWQAWDATGKQVASQERVEVDPATSRQVELPDKARLVTVELRRTSAHLALELGGSGRSVMALPELVTGSLVPHVRPALR